MKYLAITLLFVLSPTIGCELVKPDEALPPTMSVLPAPCPTIVPAPVLPPTSLPIIHSTITPSPEPKPLITIPTQHPPLRVPENIVIKPYVSPTAVKYPTIAPPIIVPPPVLKTPVLIPPIARPVISPPPVMRPPVLLSPVIPHR